MRFNHSIKIVKKIPNVKLGNFFMFSRYFFFKIIKLSVFEIFVIFVLALAFGLFFTFSYNDFNK